MKIRHLIYSLLVLALISAPSAARPRIWPFGKKKTEVTAQSADTVKKKTPYEKLFAKGDSLSRGLLDVHFVKGKVYFEVPDSLLGRVFILGSTVKATSDNTNGVVGSKDDLIPFTFTKADSSIFVRDVNFDVTSGDSDILSALSKSNIGGVRRKFKIAAVSPSGKSVIDVSEWFLTDDENIRPLLKLSPNAMSAKATRSQNFKKDLSFIKGTKSFSDNLSVTSSLSYTYTMTDESGKSLVKDKPFTAEVTRSILLLPEKTYHPRMADPRMNFFFTGRMTMGSGSRGSKAEYFANRWRLEPSDTAAYRRGEKVEPVKPITYYIDSDFPAWWKPYIFEAVEQWNEVFESIGFKNAVRALPFPEDDPSFDPDNIRYSCIRYAPIGIRNAMGPSWVDPRSGEIINASVYVYHDVISLLYNWMFVQTAQADPDVRAAEIPRELLGDALMYVIKHEVGHTLGLMHNMSGSSVIPTELLRDPAFTSVNGTTTSIMDYARFNYVAQPGDKERGVKLTPPRFGKNDYWAIRWGYTPVFDCPSFEAEAEITSGWITDSLKAAPFYRYGKQQVYGDGSIFFDPRNQVEDLGDDVVASSKYGTANLKYILERYLSWIDAASDPDYEIRMGLYSTILNQYLRYFTHVYNNVGGLYRNEVVAGDGFPRYENVPRERQKACLKYLFEMYEDTGWLDDPAVLGALPLIGSPARTIEDVFIQLIMSIPYRESISDGVASKEFTSQEAYEAIYNYVFKPTVQRRTLSEKQRNFQRKWVEMMMYSGAFAAPPSPQRGFAPSSAGANLGADGASPAAVPCGEVCTFGSDDSISLVYNPVSGFEWLPRDTMVSSNMTQGVIYRWLMKAYDIMTAAKTGASADDKAHYELLLNKIAYSLK